MAGSALGGAAQQIATPAMSRFMDPSQTGGATNVVRQPGGMAPAPTAATGGKGGGSAAYPAPQRETVNQVTGVGAPAGGFNINQAAAGGLQAAMQGTAAGMNYQPMQVGAASYRPATATSQGFQAAKAGSTGYNASTIAGAAPIRAQNVQAGQIASTNLGAYTNPYETQVVNTALGDLERSRQMQQNQLGAQASAARAFGGSRQGIAEAETNRAFAQQAANTAAQLRQAGYGQAQQLAGQDIATRMQAGLANQQAGLTAQGQTAANVLAAQQANQAARNQAGQFGAAAANQAALQNAANLQAARQFGAGAANTAALQNQAARNQASQFGASAQNAAMMANQAAGLQGAQQRLGAASQMGQLGQQAFNTSQAITNQQLQQGTLQQALQQQLIDAARGQYAGFTGAPAASLAAPLAALGVVPNQSTTTQSQQPGLFNYLSLPFML